MIPPSSCSFMEFSTDTLKTVTIYGCSKAAAHGLSVG